ncbi:hypothetical protein RRG08_025005 [Elysia crispata]|uniref:Uncharacterized protein n=1 Tax=Elysia crispata TaxID=231223 RepID=A0AAE1ANT1_9GAST|nr:hypothetical protein RRG08_025005 [Elysia crispata]
MGDRYIGCKSKSYKCRFQSILSTESGSLRLKTTSSSHFALVEIAVAETEIATAENRHHTKKRAAHAVSKRGRVRGRVGERRSILMD